MGHTSITTTARYTHWQPKALAAMMANAIPALDDETVEAEIVDE